MVQIEQKSFQSENELIAFAQAWNQDDLTTIPAVLTTLFQELLDSDPFAKSVPIELRRIGWVPSGGYGSTQNGCQVMAVDKLGFALVRHITWYEHEDVDHSTFSTVSLAEAQTLRKTYCETSPHKVNEIGLSGDYGPQAFDGQQERKMT